MTFPTSPIEPADLYAMMGPEALLAHLEALVAAIAGAGAEVTPDARRGVDELAECIVELMARTDTAALARHAARLQAALHGGAN